ncbi:MAG: glycine--tRNA ligase subunit beta [Reyranella sp.]|uniref:glycine--tRNA ligase subunit beta n=1 Tax=Reyranella sp. TaxID=1929291 RepID=UPI00272F387F|nr:glycine--tRNA ligase subunit beta [Reyranella sp.]MDP1964425.1 glycine--tRNA ligase subunit beta [Reyranella sp.]MDP2374539.1 glycine--tRNA ligase subunit beta [Reyranella sp.]
MAEFLLELLSEEIPARMQARAAEDLKRLVSDGLKAAGLTFTDARAFATPRRLALAVDGLPVARADVSEERRGPRVGAPDQAIQGFLKGAGLASLDQAEKRDTGKGEFWFAVINKKGGPTAEALPGIIEAAMKALPWPKSMKWGSGTMMWVRPLQSIVALFDGKVLAGEVAPGGAMKPIAFGDATRGHRFLSTGEFKVASFADYTAKLRVAHVMLDPTERKKIILEGAEKLCADAQVTLKTDEGLLDEVAGLVEWPVPLLGTIDAAFMDVPPEVLIVSMKNHQRYFATTKADGALANRFVVVANNVARDGGKTIAEGNERVLRARLSDAKFFWDQDRKTTLESRLPALKGIVFHAKLGTQAERVERIAKLAGEIARFVPGADEKQVEQAARLAKADLVTGMVGEFPELQGIMGCYYARGEKLPAAVADAIGDHYAPAGPNDRCPDAPVSIAVALADKLDALVSFWSVGEKPTGSRDPFALRRAALGIIRIVVENKIRLPLRNFFKADDLMDFFAERLKVQMREKGVRHDVVDAIFALGNEDDLVRLLARVEALQSFLGSEAGKNLLTAYGRAANIVRAEEKKDKGLAAKIAGAPDVALLEQVEEKAVVTALTEIERSLGPALKAEDFAGAMAAFAGLRAPIDAYFEKVTVNVTDRPDLRLNRLKLLNQIRATMDSVAHFSKIEG